MLKGKRPGNATKKSKTRNSPNGTGANLGFEAKLWPSLTTCPQTGKDDYSLEKKRGKTMKCYISGCHMSKSTHFLDTFYGYVHNVDMYGINE